MTTEERNKRNEAIAVFMGGKLSKPRNMMNAPYWNIPGHSTHLGNPDKVYTLYYHRFWDWLMPVVEKIESMGYPVSIKEKCCIIYGNRLFGCVPHDPGTATKIDSGFLVVSDFCINYNKSKS